MKYRSAEGIGQFKVALEGEEASASHQKQWTLVQERGEKETKKDKIAVTLKIETDSEISQ